MKITKVTAYVVKVPKEYKLAGQTSPRPTLPTSDYLNVPPYSELYSRYIESMVVKVETDEGIFGWGESQAPIGPEVAQTIVNRVLAPVVLGRDPLETGVRQFEMYQTLRSRGQTAGFQFDAIASIDTALWDIRGKVAGRPISSLLGGRHREKLSAYVTCLTADTREGRMEEAAEWSRQGIGVKPMLGFGYAKDAQEAQALRKAIGESARLMIDGVWRYGFPEAVRLGRVLEELDVDFFEAPLAPEDIRGHARLARELRLPIAVGEPIRGRFHFVPWFQAEAMDICQPDQMRNGVTETFKIATLAEAFNLPVALHVGAVTTVGMAATWQVASAISNFYIQEHEPQMLELFNPWLVEPLRLEDGQLVVPSSAGLGIQIDEPRMMRDVIGSVEAALD